MSLLCRCHRLPLQTKTSAVPARPHSAARAMTVKGSTSVADAQQQQGPVTLVSFGESAPAQQLLRHALHLPNATTHPLLAPTHADVDGTLLHSVGKEANRLHKECFSAGFKEVFGLDTNIDVVAHHGSTGGDVTWRACVCCRTVGAPACCGEKPLNKLPTVVVLLRMHVFARPPDCAQGAGGAP